MKVDNPFDRKLETWGNNIPEHVRKALVDTNDTLDFAWASAQSIFGDSATPEHALKICEMMLTTINANTARPEL